MSLWYIDAQQVIFRQNLTVAVTASCLNCLNSVDLVVVSSSLPSELNANRPYSGKKADLVCFSSSSPSLSPLLLSLIILQAHSCSLHSDQTIINSNMTIGLEDSLNRAKVIIYSEEAFRWLSTVRLEKWEDRRVEERRGEWLDDHVRQHLLTYLFFCSPSHLICVHIRNNWWRCDCIWYVLWQLYLFSFVYCFLFIVFCFVSQRKYSNSQL